MKNPEVRKMVEEAIKSLGGEASNQEIKAFILNKWNDVNPETIGRMIIMLTVNHDSRIHYPENQKLRQSNSGSPYDLLFRTNRGKVTVYFPHIHGVWEIVLKNGQFSILNIEGEKRIYSPENIKWIKNITNSKGDGAYLKETKSFILDFPTKHRKNALSPKVGDIIILRQKINKTSVLTHLVTPLDNILQNAGERAAYRYGRKVKILAKVNSPQILLVKFTEWKRIKFNGISQGNACFIKNINSVGNVENLLIDTWHHFSPFFMEDEQESNFITTGALQELNSLENDLSVPEGKLKLISHFVKERNPTIIREKKLRAMESNTLHCEVCEFSFQKVFNKNFIECHHLDPISQGGERETNLDDLALVCPNCHRMLHQKFNGEYLSILELQKVINENGANKISIQKKSIIL